MFCLTGSARAEQNDLVREADGFYTFEHHPVAEGWPHGFFIAHIFSLSGRQS